MPASSSKLREAIARRPGHPEDASAKGPQRNRRRRAQAERRQRAEPAPDGTCVLSPVDRASPTAPRDSAPEASTEGRIQMTRQPKVLPTTLASLFSTSVWRYSHPID